MVTAIVGGSIMPMLMGWMADRYSMRVGFLMPLVCFAFIAIYAFSWRRLLDRDLSRPAASESLAAAIVSQETA
jgi:FHS family L-fucose permease-like MFS transporter